MKRSCELQVWVVGMNQHYEALEQKFAGLEGATKDTLTDFWQKLYDLKREIAEQQKAFLQYKREMAETLQQMRGES